MNLLAAIESSAIGSWIRESEWGYPIVLICHTIGMALLAGVTLGLAVRSVLAGARAALGGCAPLLRFAWGGFALSFVSGCVLFAGAAQRFSAHPAFQIKVAALSAGTALLLVLSRRLAAQQGGVRWLGAASIVLWVAAIAAGRLMAYLR